MLSDCRCSCAPPRRLACAGRFACRSMRPALLVLWQQGKGLVLIGGLLLIVNSYKIPIYLIVIVKVWAPDNRLIIG